MGKEFDMFDDLFKDEDFSLEDEKDEEEGEEIEMETSDDVDDSDTCTCGPDDGCADCDPICDPDLPCDCMGDPMCSKAEDDSWDTGQRNWDTGGGQRPVPDNVWKPKSWKTS